MDCEPSGAVVFFAFVGMITTIIVVMRGLIAIFCEDTNESKRKE